eukprot:6785363-Alexandrium_andersonii.AAC.1
MSSRVPLFPPSTGPALRPGPVARPRSRPCVRPRRRTARGLPFGGSPARLPLAPSGGFGWMRSLPEHR